MFLRKMNLGTNLFECITVILPLIRIIIDPKLLNSLKTTNESKTLKILQDPNLAFLGSSQNNLLVCGILKGISNMLKNNEVQEGDASQT